MLYGMDDDEFNEFGLVTKQQLNIKKVIIAIAIFLVCIFFVIITILTSNPNNNENNELLAITDEENLANDGITLNNDGNEMLEVANELSNIEENFRDTNKQVSHMQISKHDIAKISEQFLPQPNENGVEQIKNIYYSDEKQVYLTFDDGPSKDITPQVLEILKQHDVKATFFVLGARVELYPDTLKRIYNEGHYIANHGYSHKYSEIYQSKDTVFQEYVDCENAIKNALNNQSYNSYLFRFPGGSSGGRYSKIKAEAREHLISYGVAFTNWNCLTGDAEGKETKEDCIEEMLKTKGDQNSIILLMHDSNDKPQTVEALPDIIQYFKNEGYTFKTFYEIF